jgi:hypothetical protein
MPYPSSPPQTPSGQLPSASNLSPAYQGEGNIAEDFVCEWGEFFPVELSPHGYNETVAQDYYPLTQSEVLQKGWGWRDEEESSGYQGHECDIPDDLCSVDNELLGKVLVCEGACL